MGYAAERQAIEQRFAAAWSQTPTAWDNVDFAPPEGAAWVRFHIEGGEAEQLTIGAPVVVRHRGTIQIAIFVPLGSGAGTLAALADQASAIFRLATFEGIVCDTADKHPLGPRDNWFGALLEIPFRRDELSQTP